MLTIQVTFVNGRLVGRRSGDRWNLDWMNREYLGVKLCDSYDICTTAQVDTLRRCLKAEGFALKLYRDGILIDMTERERAAFPRALPPAPLIRERVRKLA